MEAKEKEVKETLEERIEHWKAKYKNVFCYEVEKENGERITCYLRQPSRQIVSAATAIAKGDPMKYNEAILRNCLLEGGEDLIKEDSTFFGLSQKVDELVNATVGALKKL